MKLKPSPQQQAFLDWVEKGTGSAVIEAVAGSGKTTTLIMGLEKPEGTVAFMAYNRAVADEIGKRIASLNLGGRVKSGTVHSFGSVSLRNAYPLSVKGSDKKTDDKNKIKMIADKVVDKKGYVFFAKLAASMAKQVGLGVYCDINDAEEWANMISHHSLADVLPDYADLSKGISYAQEILRVNNLNVKKVYDFDDMVYIPVLEDLEMVKYDWVFLDEAQDTNLVRRELAKRMLAPNGRLVAVGDSHQAIYGFTGADSRSMQKISEELNCIHLPLTVSYRCPKKVVSTANQWVSHIEAAKDAPDGIVDSCDIDTLIKNSEFSEKDVILCRKTKPLVELAFNLIRAGIPCKVEGRSIGTGLASITRKWKVSTVRDLEFKLKDWRAREIEKAVKRGDYSRCDYIDDQVETLRVMMDGCKPNDSIETLVGKINSFFKDSENDQATILTLSTIHRAKGKEWDRVFVLDMDKHSPSRWAKKPWELEQETNLCYVQVTRAKKHLTFMHSDSPHREKGSNRYGF